MTRPPFAYRVVPEPSVAHSLLQLFWNYPVHLNPNGLLTELVFIANAVVAIAIMSQGKQSKVPNRDVFPELPAKPAKIGGTPRIRRSTVFSQTFRNLSARA